MVSFSGRCCEINGWSSNTQYAAACARSWIITFFLYADHQTLATCLAAANMLYLSTLPDCTGAFTYNTNKSWWSWEEVCCWVLSYTNHPSLHTTSVQHLPFTTNQWNWCTHESAFTSKPHSPGSSDLRQYDNTTYLWWVCFRTKRRKMQSFTFHYPVWAIYCT